MEEPAVWQDLVNAFRAEMELHDDVVEKNDAIFSECLL